MTGETKPTPADIEPGAARAVPATLENEGDSTVAERLIFFSDAGDPCLPPDVHREAVDQYQSRVRTFRRRRTGAAPCRCLRSPERAGRHDPMTA
jgi:hypothetical protein